MATDAARTGVPEPTVVATILAVAGIAAAVLHATGVAAWPLVIVALLAAGTAAVRRFGMAAGLGIAPVAVLVPILLVLTATGAVGWPIGAGVVGALLVVVVAAALAIALDRGRSTAVLDRAALAMLLPASAVATVFPVVVLVAGALPGAANLAWVMRGDSANNLLFAREILQRGGIAVGAGENPVPLPSSLIAVVASSGRGAVPADGLLLHDLVALAVVWTGLIALCCLLCGVVAAAVVRSLGGRMPAVAIASGAAAMLPLSWIYSGYAIESGFINTHVVSVVLLCAVLIAIGGGARPVAAIGWLALTALLVLAIWSPFVLVPIALAIIVAGSGARRLRAAVRGEVVFAAAAILLLLAYGAAVVLPSLLRQGVFLASAGTGFPFPSAVLPALACGAAVLAVVAAGRMRSRVVAIVAGIAVAVLVGLGALLAVAGFAWSYYPLKFAWIASLLLLVVVIGLAIAMVDRVAGTRRALAAAGAALVAAALVAAAWFGPGAVSSGVLSDPSRAILSGSVLGAGDEVAERILGRATPTQATVFWNSGLAFEHETNFWILQMWAGEITSDPPLRHLAYATIDPSRVDELCRIVDLMGGEAIVVTADLSLGDAAREQCPLVRLTVVAVEGG